MCLKETGCYSVERINLVQGRAQWQDPDTVGNKPSGSIKRGES
jgi:hypothetical protein